MRKRGAAIIGPGNIGTDLMFKIERTSSTLELIAMAGVDASSEGLTRARALGKAITSNGVEGLVALDEFSAIDVVFDATSAAAHVRNDAVLASYGKRVVDLTPAALGPFVVPPVNLATVAHARNLNMVTCGGQATIPIVAAINAVAKVHYAEIIASIASTASATSPVRQRSSAVPNIPSWVTTTSRAPVPPCSTPPPRIPCCRACCANAGTTRR